MGRKRKAEKVMDREEDDSGNDVGEKEKTVKKMNLHIEKREI